VFGFIIGCVFALAGLIFVAVSVVSLDDMKKSPEVVYVPGDTHDIHDEGGYSLSGGFGPGLGAFFAMIFVGVGTGIAGASATTSPGIRRGIAAILALAWHGVGIGMCWCYCSLAPALDVYPFLIVMVYEWLGLIPLGSAIPESGLMGRLRSAVWYAMGGGFLGGVGGAVVGGVVGGVAVVLSYAVGSRVIGTNWWLYAAMGGGLTTGVVFALCRLTGWEISSGDDEEEEEESDEEEGEEPQTPRSALCRKCRMPVESGLTECPYCRAPMRARRDWPVGRIFTGVGLVCVVGTWLGWSVLQNWLIGKGFNPTVLSYLFYLIFFGGWIMIGIGSLLSPSKPGLGSPSDSGGADESEEDTDEQELPYV